MLWMLVSVSLSVNSIYMNEKSCELAAEKMREQKHDAICFPIDPDAEMAVVGNNIQKFVDIMKGFTDETRR